MAHTALIIDDEADIRELIAMSLDRIGLNTHTAANLSEARNLLASYQFDVCLTDMRLPDGNGVEFVKYILSVQPNLPVAVITAHGNMDAAVDAMKNGAFDFVSKPVDLSLLRKLVTQAIQINSTSADVAAHDFNLAAASASKKTNVDSNSIASTNSRTRAGDKMQARAFAQVSTARPTSTSSPDLRNAPLSATDRQTTPDTSKSVFRLQSISPDTSPASKQPELIGQDRLIGQSEPMQALKKMILKVARTNAPVWITGESGTGKELIARLVHDNGPRTDAPFVAINCGAIPSELMESEMFGHRKGSFTGAHSDHDGLFKRADGGTLFLDEVAELPLHMQVKLLRAIQERTVRPVGSSDEISTNVRILSASHKDLADEVEQARFRHDLYYRLNVICIKSPSLRDRRDDVVIIARHVLNAIALSEGSTNRASLSPEAEDLLSAYSFPGNVRELENILERAVALSDNACLEASDLNLDIVTTTHAARYESANSTIAANDANERQVILDALEQTRWNRKAAAKKLGMTYRQLRYRIQQYDIDDDQSQKRR